MLFEGEVLSIYVIKLIFPVFQEIFPFTGYFFEEETALIPWKLLVLFALFCQVIGRYGSSELFDDGLSISLPVPEQLFKGETNFTLAPG